MSISVSLTSFLLMLVRALMAEAENEASSVMGAGIML